jgi:outer membrane receptor protein involved in Fe transport
MSNKRRHGFNHLVAVVAAALAAPAALAGEASPSLEELDEVVVRGQIVYRDRVDATAPVLEYGLDYFQRFEPTTVGDMLKRVPGVGFLSDVNEYDGVRLRGLDAAYTKILINGKKVPGAEADRSFWVDRIPAELVERIEIVRNSSADAGADGVGGALNIVLKDGGELDGGYLRGGAQYYDGDSKWKPSAAGVLGGNSGDMNYALGFNAQGRHNPKSKVTDFWDGDGDFGDEEFYVGRELESDVRDGMDYSTNFSLNGPLGAGDFGVRGFYVHTDRDEHEDVQKFEVDDGDLVLEEIEAQDENIQQDNYSFDVSFGIPVGMGRTSVDLGFARFKNRIVSTAFQADAGDPLEEDERELDNTRDREFSATLAHAFDLASGKLKLGVDWQNKRRDGDVTVQGWDSDVGDWEDPEASADAVYRIKERRLDSFVKYSGEFGALLVEAGLRYETTDVDMFNPVDEVSASNDYSLLAPSLHLRRSVNESSRIYASVSRTARRPNFDVIAPYEVEFGEEDLDLLRGNPGLEPERAWGMDVGFERRLGRQGIVGINLLYRQIDDVIEVVATGEVVDNGEDPAGQVYQARNVNDGKVWGVELDLSTPLSALNMDETGVFLNAAWLDSEIVDPILGSKRRFLNQPGHIFNIGFIQNLPGAEAAFGATFRKQGAGTGVELGEIRRTSYEGDLELFVEKRFGMNWVVRLAASNLLDAKKIEKIRNYEQDTVEDTIADMLDNSVDEFELESEQAGPILQLVFRATF